MWTKSLVTQTYIIHVTQAMSLKTKSFKVSTQNSYFANLPSRNSRLNSGVEVFKTFFKTNLVTHVVTAFWVTKDKWTGDKQNKASNIQTVNTWQFSTNQNTGAFNIDQSPSFSSFSANLILLDFLHKRGTKEASVFRCSVTLWLIAVRIFVNSLSATGNDLRYWSLSFPAKKLLAKLGCW